MEGHLHLLRRRRHGKRLLVVVVMLHLRRRVIAVRLLLLLVVVVLLLLPVLLLLRRRWSKTASSISRTVGVVHLNVVRHLIVRGSDHGRGVAPARDCVLVERERREKD